MNTRIIFLDFDGVLVTLQSLKDRHQCGLNGDIVANRKCIYALNWITRMTGAKIVVISAWRFSGLLEIRAIAALWGIMGEIIGITSDLTTRRPGGLWEGSERWKEIGHWLTENPVDSFVILDDLKDFGPYAGHHVCTDEKVGLTEQHASSAIKILTASGSVHNVTVGAGL